MACLISYGPIFVYSFLNMTFPNENSPVNAQFRMFLPTLTNQMSDEQKKKWLSVAQNFQIIGNYAQMGSGMAVLLVMLISWDLCLYLNI